MSESTNLKKFLQHLNKAYYYLELASKSKNAENYSSWYNTTKSILLRIIRQLHDL